jgi:hypothetical protein
MTLQCSGLQTILNRMPNVRGIHLDEAMELCREFFPGMVSYPFKEGSSKRKRMEEEPTAGPSGVSNSKKKKSKKEGKLTPKDDRHLRKYCSENMSETETPSAKTCTKV